MSKNFKKNKKFSTNPTQKRAQLGCNQVDITFRMRQPFVHALVYLIVIPFWNQAICLQIKTSIQIWLIKLPFLVHRFECLHPLYISGLWTSLPKRSFFCHKCLWLCSFHGSDDRDSDINPAHFICWTGVRLCCSCWCHLFMPEIRN